MTHYSDTGHVKLPIKSILQPVLQGNSNVSVCSMVMFEAMMQFYPPLDTGFERGKQETCQRPAATCLNPWFHFICSSRLWCYYIVWTLPHFLLSTWPPLFLKRTPNTAEPQIQNSSCMEGYVHPISSLKVTTWSLWLDMNAAEAQTKDEEQEQLTCNYEARNRKKKRQYVPTTKAT